MPRVWIAVIALAAASCYAPSVREGLPCDDACPSGQVCVGGRCWLEGQVPDGPGAADAIADAGTARDDALAGHDEDGDGIRDEDDGCPHVHDPGQPDADGDGVNDACDPLAMTPGERIAFFDPLTAPRPEWSLSMTGWAYTSDAVIGTDTASATLAITLGAGYVEFGGELTEIGGFPRQLGLELSDGVAEGRHYCEIWGPGATTDFQLTHAIAGDFIPQDELVLPALAPARFRMIGIAYAAQGAALCGLELDDVTYEVSDTGPLVPTTGMGLWLQGMTVRIDYLIQIVTE